MKSFLGISGFAALAIALTTAPRTASAQEQVYVNTNVFQAQFATGSLEVGNQITLGGDARTITSFSFEYYLPVATGNETAEVKFYANDSTNSFAGYTDPGTVLYDSGSFNIGDFGSQSSATLNFDQSTLNGGVLVPGSFTWTVEFGNLAADETVGVDLYNPVTVGSAYADMWEYQSNSWELVTNATYALRIGSELDATPTLSIAATNNQVMVYWPSPTTGWTLQENTNLLTTNWITPMETVNDDGTNKFILVNPALPAEFYRLKSP